MSATTCTRCDLRVAMRGRDICTACEDAKPAAEPASRWRVRFSNYEPAEVDSTWPTKAEAEARVDELNGDGGGMWEVRQLASSAHRTRLSVMGRGAQQGRKA